MLTPRIVLAGFVLKLSALCPLSDAVAEDGGGLTDVVAKSNGPTTIMAKPFVATNSATEEYQKERLRLLVQEANRVAEKMQLPENLPITKSDLVQWYVCPFARAQERKAIRMVVTRNYAYYISKDNKFCYLEKTGQLKERRAWQTQYSWPMSRMDTNGAYQLATQWLAAASMDVAGLNRDCQLRIIAHTAKGNTNDTHFVPLYWVYWTQGAQRQGSVASVELFAPTRTLVQLRVEDPAYILRKRLQIPDLNSVSIESKH